MKEGKHISKEYVFDNISEIIIVLPIILHLVKTEQERIKIIMIKGL